MYSHKRMKLIARAFILVSFLLVMGTINLTAADNDRDKSYDVSPGVHHSSFDLDTEDGHQAMQMLEVDLTNPDVEVFPYTSENEVYGPETIGNTISELRDQDMNIVAGTNGDFFSSVGVPSGLQITDGELFTSKRNMKASVLIFPDDTIKIDDDIKMNATITTESGETLEFNMFNRSRVATHENHAMLFNYRFNRISKTVIE